MYDIRSKNPLYVKEHQYGLPVIDVTFHNTSKNVISTDKKVVKIWERHEPAMGKVLTNIETPADINALHCVADKRGIYRHRHECHESVPYKSPICMYALFRSVRTADACWGAEQGDALLRTPTRPCPPVVLFLGGID